VHGGLSTSERDGRYAGSYDFESTFDLDSLAGLDDSRLYLLLKGGWPEAGSIDPAAIGSFHGVNGDAITGQWAQLSDLWFERSFVNRMFLWRVGKLDLTGGFQHRGSDVAFDGSWYANDETTQFLNGALVNNPTIPFPGLTLGSAFFAGLGRDCHVAVALAARDADGTGDEFASWGSSDNGLFCIVEAGYMPWLSREDAALAGDYHAGLWWETKGDTEDTQRGFYVSVSQPLIMTTDDPLDGGLGLFARAGWTDGVAAELETFRSVGLQYQGLLAQDGTDVLGVGLARGSFVDSTDVEVPTGSETAVEFYYNAPVIDWMNVSPSVQYVADPGGETVGRDALVIGLRLQVLLE
jgi:carbohydrate-selective porin OprB